MCRSYGNQFDNLVKDKDDISSYLKKQYELRNEQVLDLNDRLLGLQKAKDQQKESLEKSLRECQENARMEIERLENENFLLSNVSNLICRCEAKRENDVLLGTRLSALEEFKQNRHSLEMTIEELRSLIQKKEEAYHQALTEMEIALIRFKDRYARRRVGSNLTFAG